MNIRITEITGTSTAPVRSLTFVEFDSAASGSEKATLQTVLGAETKQIMLLAPTVSSEATIFFTPVAVTITKLVQVVRGTTPSATFDVRHHTDRSNAGNALITTPSAVTSQTTGTTVTSFADATVPANSFVWLEFDAMSGTVDEAVAAIQYTQD